nr:hypothetical protein HAGR004_19210 [Bdellovibrio sp. HAGR004]
MNFELETTQRTVWELADRVEFLNRMRPLLNISDAEAEEIKELLQERDFDYLEIAACPIPRSLTGFKGGKSHVSGPALGEVNPT